MTTLLSRSFIDMVAADSKCRLGIAGLRFQIVSDCYLDTGAQKEISNVD
jgi:hypothetical protein